MTPKEKAIELVDKFSNVPLLDNYESYHCALLAVKEIIEALHEHHWQNRNVIEYYKEVKHELEKL